MESFAQYMTRSMIGLECLGPLAVPLLIGHQLPDHGLAVRFDAEDPPTARDRLTKPPQFSVALSKPCQPVEMQFAKLLTRWLRPVGVAVVYQEVTPVERSCFLECLDRFRPLAAIGQVVCFREPRLEGFGVEPEIVP